MMFIIVPVLKNIFDFIINEHKIDDTEFVPWYFKTRLAEDVLSKLHDVSK